MDEREQQRKIRHRLAVLRCAEEVTGSVAATCRYYGISRPTFYKWRNRYEELGPEGPRDRLSCPHHSPRATKSEVVGKIVYLRQHYHFGLLKIAMCLKRYCDIEISDSGVWKILDRLGMGRLPANQRYKQRWKRYEKPQPGNHNNHTRIFCVTGRDGRCVGGNQPVEVSSMARRLCFEERVRIEGMAQAGCSAAGSARRLGRRPAAVQRELGRWGPGTYCAEAAQAAADARAERPKAPRLVADAVLAGAVQRRLDQRWSPHAISADLRAAGMHVCAETIYRGCYDRSGRSGLKPGSWKKLPRRRRKPRGRCEQAKRSALGDYRPIADRPAAADRSGAGHWEGDLIVGRADRTAVATLVERTSRCTLVVGLPGGYDAQSTAEAVTAALGRQPDHMVKTLTWNQGREMARWTDIEDALDIKVCSCQPRSPWQRPTNEQANGLLRRWPPKSTDLDLGPVPLALIEDNLNEMPRKLHHRQSAQTIYTALSSNHR